MVEAFKAAVSKGARVGMDCVDKQKPRVRLPGLR